ncbi:hypothetical protein MMC30_008935 [Trapelia coarctata]|nr:hypothetical protein [Trapelia coarctata]
MTTTSGMELPSLRGLQTTEQMQLLDIVDSLRAQGLSEFTALPQLIVCGDQSSGKSSVLEAISGVPFPRQDDICTRFATEVILRRASNDGISVSIVPAKEKPLPDQERLKQFSHTLATRDDFPALFKKAKGAMGLSDAGKGFSRDILRVEIRGPTQPQLTLVDLPGLIHSETMSQTAQDVEMVKKLVAEYMTYSRSIILAVVSAKNDVGNQIVLRKAREVDPEGKRTLGIITKPDTLPKDSGSEKTFLRLARNEDVKFHLGWHVVRNLDTAIQDTNAKARDEQEKSYFQDSNFGNLPSSSVGIDALRTRLSKILFNQIRVELPRLFDDIESKLSSNKSELDKLGPSRVNEQEQRAYLTKLSEEFQMICRDAIRGDYDHPFFQDGNDHERRCLCAVIMNLHFTFADELRENGARWKITDDLTSYDKGLRTREYAIDDTCKLLKRYRGRELAGLANPNLVGKLFRDYSSPWEELAQRHIKTVWEATNRFLELVLAYISDDDVSDAVLRFWLDPIMETRLEAAHSELKKLTAVHQQAPMTTNHDALKELRKAMRNPVSQDLTDELEEISEQGDGTEVTINAEDAAAILSLTGQNTNTHSDLMAAEDAFDNMQAFYQIAMRLFMDNVPSLAIQAPIILEVPSMLSPTAVSSMTGDIIARLAGESEEKRTCREELERRKETLENGARMCKQYAMRPTFATSSKHGTSSQHPERSATLIVVESEDTTVKQPARSAAQDVGQAKKPARPSQTKSQSNSGSASGSGSVLLSSGAKSASNIFGDTGNPFSRLGNNVPTSNPVCSTPVKPLFGDDKALPSLSSTSQPENNRPTSTLFSSVGNKPAFSFGSGFQSETNKPPFDLLSTMPAQPASRADKGFEGGLLGDNTTSGGSGGFGSGVFGKVPSSPARPSSATVVFGKVPSTPARPSSATVMFGKVPSTPARPSSATGGSSDVAQTAPAKTGGQHGSVTLSYRGKLIRVKLPPSPDRAKPPSP